MISYWLAQFLSRDNKTSARNKKILFQQPKKPWKKDSTRCLHLSTRVNGYLKLLYFEQATVIANRVGYAVFFFSPPFSYTFRSKCCSINISTSTEKLIMQRRRHSNVADRRSRATLNLTLLLLRVMRKIQFKTNDKFRPFLFRE